MADAQSNSGGPSVDPPGMAKKKKVKAPRKPLVECTPEEIAELDAESAKRSNRRAVVKDNAATRKFAAERNAIEAARRKAEVEEKEAIVNKAHALLMLGICHPAGFSAAAIGPASTGSSVARSPHCQSPASRTTPMSPGFPPPRHDAHTRFSGSPYMSVIAPSTPRPSACIDLNVTPGSSSGGRLSVKMQRKQARPPFAGTMSSPRVLFEKMPTPMALVNDPYCTQFMEDVIYNGGHVPTYDPEEIQSQDGHAQFVADEEADDRADYDHGDSWHEDHDIYCEGDGDGDEDEGNDIDISGEPLFIDELIQRAEAQKRKKSICTGSYTQDEDKLIYNCCMEISQDLRTGAQQKGLVF
ncbi:Formin-like protein 15 [Hordeum vulgare]|nr:Formin-like protein 15 [Hordeum vulgare]